MTNFSKKRGVNAVILLVSLTSIFLYACHADEAKTALSSSEISQFLEQRRKLVDKSLEVLRDEKNDRDFNSPLHQAIGLVGELRVTSAIPLLCKRLSYLPQIKDDKDNRLEPFLATESYYPCAIAVVRIGEPSETIGRMISILSSTENTTERSLACWVIMTLRGRGSAVTLLEERKKHTSEQTQLLLGSAIKYIQGYQQTYGHPNGSGLIGGPNGIKGQLLKPGEPWK